MRCCKLGAARNQQSCSREGPSLIFKISQDKPFSPGDQAAAEGIAGMAGV